MIATEFVDVLIIGGGPAGMAAALGAADAGAGSILIVDGNDSLGGILNQCVHNGFGIQVFNEELTGPEYSQRLIDMVITRQISVSLQTEAVRIDDRKTVTLVSPDRGEYLVQAKAVIVCTGCYERTRESIQIPGSRPSSVYTAGSIQEMINIYGYVPGSRAVILGSGDIGLIMARRLSLEGVKVLGVYEINPSPSGLNRNLVQCLFDFEIPLYLSKTIIDIHGSEQVESVTVIDVDERGQSIAGTEQEIPCDLLVLSLGLIPDLSVLEGLNLLLDERTGLPLIDEKMRSTFEGVYITGNAAYVHDLVDNVHAEAYAAGQDAARFADGGEWLPAEPIRLMPGQGVASLSPNLISEVGNKVCIYFRVAEQVKNVEARLLGEDGRIVARRKYHFLAKNQYYKFAAKLVSAELSAGTLLIFKVTE